MVGQNRIDPERVPQVQLADGWKLPGIGMGTFGGGHYSPEQVAAAVRGALQAGYRLVDCAPVYGNEAALGPVFKEFIASGASRSELKIISKVWNDMHGPGDVLRSCVRSLKDLGLEYLDLFLVHWPFTDTPGPYRHREYMKTWAQMERLHELGLVRGIGVSNMSAAKLKLLLREARVKPVVNEIELHPCFQQPELFRFCLEHGIRPIGYCPIGSPKRPERNVEAGDAVDTENPAVKAVAENHRVHPAVICLKWAVQRGQIPIPFSVHATKYVANLRSVTEDPLSAAEMDLLQTADRNCRLMKGKGFLWDGARDWHDLWDEDGIIRGCTE